MQRSYVSAVVLFAVVLVAALAVSGANSRLTDRGDYIVNHVALCADCHTPKLAGGKPDLKRKLGGAPIMFKPTVQVPDWRNRAPNLTSSGFLNKWTDAQLAKFLMTGIGPDGAKADLPMPQYRLDEQDAKAVTAYLRCLPPVR